MNDKEKRASCFVFTIVCFRMRVFRSHLTSADVPRFQRTSLVCVSSRDRFFITRDRA